MAKDQTASPFTCRLSRNAHDSFDRHKVNGTKSKLPAEILTAAAKLLDEGKDPLAMLRAGEKLDTEAAPVGTIQPERITDDLNEQISKAIATSFRQLKADPFQLGLESEKFMREALEQAEEMLSQFSLVAIELMRHTTNTSTFELENWIKSIFPDHKFDSALFTPKGRRSKK